MSSVRVAMLGATGAVGSVCIAALLARPDVERVTVFGRRLLTGLPTTRVNQYVVNLEDPGTYAEHLPGHDAAICTLGVGQPSKVSRAEFVRVDKDLPLLFARACRGAAIHHFALLSSVGADARSRSFYLRTKGELEDALRALQFERLSLFHPSMILTPINRYGMSQGLLLAVWPRLTPLLVGPLRKYRGVPVDVLGHALAARVGRAGPTVETLEWDDLLAARATV